MAGLIIDGILVFMAILFVIRHTRLGFVRSILESFKAVVAFAIAFIFRAPLARFFESAFMNKVVTKWVYKSLSKSAAGGDPTVDFVSLYDDCRPAYKLLSKFGLNTENLEEQFANISTLGEDGILSLAENIGSALAWLASLTLALIALFAAACLVLTLIITIFDLITRIALLNFLNKLLGAVLGIFWAAVLAFTTGVVISILSHFLPDAVSSSLITDSIILGAFEKFDLYGIIPILK